MPEAAQSSTKYTKVGTWGKITVLKELLSLLNWLKEGEAVHLFEAGADNPMAQPSLGTEWCCHRRWSGTPGILL